MAALACFQALHGQVNRNVYQVEGFSHTLAGFVYLPCALGVERYSRAGQQPAGQRRKGGDEVAITTE
jgi:hypothetical protein